MFMGNVIGGIGQSFLLFVPPTLSAVWFGEKERATASSIGGSEGLTLFFKEQFPKKIEAQI